MKLTLDELHTEAVDATHSHELHKEKIALLLQEHDDLKVQIQVICTQ